jgi:hypothetical protein
MSIASANNGAPKPVGKDRVYAYPTPDGKPNISVTRKFPGGVRFKTLTGKGVRNGLQGAAVIPPYRAPELAKAPAGEPIAVVLDEADADRLAELGIISTAILDNAHLTIHPMTRPLFAGRVVVIIYRDGEPYEVERAPMLARLLEDVPAEIRLAGLPGWRRGEPIGSWVDHDQAEGLRALMEQAEAWEPDRPEPTPDPEPEPDTIPIRDRRPEAPGISPGSRPVIICGSQAPEEGLKIWTPKALEALAASNTPVPRLFQRGTSLCRVRKGDQDEPPMIENLCHDGLRGMLDRVADWANEAIGKKGPFLRFGPPRMDIVRDIKSLGEMDPKSFPVLESISESPRFGPDGRLLLAPGYHPNARTFYSPSAGLEGLEIPEQPTPLDVYEAKCLILDELLVDFTFANQASRANAVACMLLPFVRLMIDGPTPNHHFTASTEGTGKGLLASACAFPYLGRDIDVNSQKESEGEWRKALTSFFLSGNTVFFVDNLSNVPGWDGEPQIIDSGTLAMAWTAPRYTDRLLGGHKEVRVKVRCVFMSSGNNVAFSRELNRRLALIELMPTEEVPSLRTGFKHDPLMEWAKQNRQKLTRACLILCQHWIAEGMKRSHYVMGSYEAYAGIMGGILDACEIPGFLGNRPKTIRRDSEASRWAALVAEWDRLHKTSPVITSDLLKIIQGNSDLSDAFAETLGDQGERSQKTRLGKALERYQGRVWGEWRIARSSVKTNNVARWKLLPKSEIVESDDDDDAKPDGGDDSVSF